METLSCVIIFVITTLPLFQLQVLVDDSSRLEAAYPGGNAEQISQQRSIVLENWKILQEKAEERKDNLNAAIDLYRFLADVSVYGCCPDIYSRQMILF